MKALVTDGDQRSALAVTRSLGRQGVSVTVGEQQPVSLASSSKYCARPVTYPSPYTDPESFGRFLIDFVERERIDVLVPVTDVTTWAVCANQDALRRHVAIAVPPATAFDAMTDKTTALQRAARCGIPIPRTQFVQGLAGLREIVEGVEYPAVVKSARSRIRTAEGWVSTGVHHVRSETDVWRLYERTDYLASHPSLIQERVTGSGFGLFVLFDHGELLTVFAHKRLRERPPSGGVSVLCESMAVDERLRDDATRLLGPLGWHGVAMLEYKQDAATGNRFLIEVNGRFWGSLQLAVSSGMDFPYLSYLLALGRRPELPPAYRLGVKNRWLLGDVDHLLLRLFRTDRELSLPEAAPSRLRTVVEWVKCTRPGVHDQVASVDDPGPFLFEARQYARSLAASAASHAQSRLDGSRPRREPVTAPIMPSCGAPSGILQSPEP
jgi:predicted ATP-grasp superfamily ATP-dependent carboligase